MQRSRSNSDPEIPAQDSRWKRLSWSITEEKQPLLGQPSNSFSPVGREQETQLNIDVDETVNETDKTLHRLLNRGEKLQDINNKANELRNTSSLFRKRSKEVETKMWWDHQYFKIAIYLLAFLLGSRMIRD